MLCVCYCIGQHCRPGSKPRGEICQCRHCRRQCEIFASGVNFSRNNAVCYINESKKLHLDDSPFFGFLSSSSRTQVTTVLSFGDDGATNHHCQHRHGHQLQTAVTWVLDELERNPIKGK